MQTDRKKEALRKDYCFVNQSAFLTDLENGTYQVTVFASSAEEVALFAEGEAVGSIPAGAKGSEAEKAFTVSIEDGRLDLEWRGASPKVYAVEISKIHQFDFGDGPAAPGFTPVSARAGYDPDIGYGFDDASKVSCTDRGTDDPLRSDFCISDGTSFSLDLPNGTYEVKIITRMRCKKRIWMYGQTGCFSFIRLEQERADTMKKPFRLRFLTAASPFNA